MLSYLKLGIVVWLLCFAGCVVERSDRNIQKISCTDNGHQEIQRGVVKSEWHSIKGIKEIVDVSTGRIKKSYKLQIDCDRDLNELIRQANNSCNIGRKLKCRIRLEHSELSDVLDETRDVPCTMTSRYIEANKRTSDEHTGLSCNYPARVSETWGCGDLRWFRLPKRFDLVFTLSIYCFESKSIAETAIGIDLNDSDRCWGLSVSDNVVCNILIQCDYYVCIDIRIVAYKGADGRCSMAGLGSNNIKD